MKFYSIEDIWFENTVKLYIIFLCSRTNGYATNPQYFIDVTEECEIQIILKGIVPSLKYFSLFKVEERKRISKIDGLISIIDGQNPASNLFIIDS